MASPLPCFYFIQPRSISMLTLTTKFRPSMHKTHWFYSMLVHVQIQHWMRTADWLYFHTSRALWLIHVHDCIATMYTQCMHLYPASLPVMYTYLCTSNRTVLAGSQRGTTAVVSAPIFRSAPISENALYQQVWRVTDSRTYGICHGHIVNEWFSK